jgi:protein O-mannosyl-transferase
MKIVIKNMIIITIIFTFYNVILYGRTDKPKVWGVVTGISNYQNVSKLKYADKDALAFYNFLIAPLARTADTNNIKLLLNEKATSYNFFEAMDHLLEVVQENDFVYIYFAGHGDVEKKTERQNGYLICYSSPTNCYAAGGSINVRDLQDYLSTLVSKNKAKVVLIIDACRAGKLAGGSEGSEVTAVALKTEWNGVIKILSCQPGETSLEGEQWGGGSGVFTHFLLKGLTGLADENSDGKVLLKELYNYLDKNVSKETDNKQMPEIVGDKKFELGIVDKLANLAELERREQLNRYPQNMQSAGLELDITSIKDETFQKMYKKFKNHIESGNLIAYSEEDLNKENALSVYRSLEGNKSAEPYINFIKGELLAGLQNRAQQKINAVLIESDLDSSGVKIIYKEIKVAFELIDSTYKQYYYLKARYLFWKVLDLAVVKLTIDSNRIKLLEDCINDDPDFPLIYAMLGMQYVQDNPNKAIKYFDKAIELSENWAAAYLFRANTKFGTDEKMSGYKDLMKALELKPDFPEALCTNGSIWFMRKEYDSALKCFDKALLIKPNYTKVYLEKGKLLHAQKKYTEAINCFVKVAQLDPKNYECWDWMGYIYNKMDSSEKAIKCYDKQIEMDSKKSSYPYSNKGNIYFNLKKYDKAIDCFGKALEIDPKLDKVWTHKGNSYYYLGKYEEAEKCYDKQIELKPEDAVGWNNKGLIIERAKKTPNSINEAIKYYDKSIELNSEYSLPWINKIIALNKLERKEEAIICCKKVFDLKKDSINFIFYMSGLLSNLKFYSSAMIFIDRLIELEPDSSTNWFMKGNALSRLGRVEESVKFIQKSIELKPDDFQAYDYLGYTYLELGKYDEALKCSDKALEINPKYGNGWYNRACIYSYLKNKEEMLKCLSKAISIEARFKTDAPKDKDFKEYYEDSDFKKLVD